MDKNFKIMFNVGKSKYVINDHNGKDTHKDGSPFYGVETFKNKKLFNNKIKELLSNGYREY